MRPHSLRWQLLPVTVRTGAANMALDEAMAGIAANTGTAIARVYGWMRPTLSFGRHQRAAGLYDAERAARMGIDIVRRPTGGRAVLHFREITYCVAAPEAALGSLREAYGAINTLLVIALRALGVDATVAAPSTSPPLPTAGACFDEPVAGEIEAQGRKLAGSAQWRADGALLQHGSILVDDDQAIGIALLREPQPAPPAAATLRAIAARPPTLGEFAEALASAIERCRSTTVERTGFERALEAAAEAHRPRYESERWTWRR
jgi:lipoate-protein ligase A